MAQATAKRDTVNLRIKPSERGLIDRAADILGKTRTDFMLDAARLAAEETLLDRTLISVSPDDYQAFLKQLDAPAQVNDRLQKTLSASPPWQT